MNTPMISQLGLNVDALCGETVIVTGAGGGIVYEAARMWSLPRSTHEWPASTNGVKVLYENRDLAGKSSEPRFLSGSCLNIISSSHI